MIASRLPTMKSSPKTRGSLLLRIRDQQNHPAWLEFVEIYAPLVHAYIRSRGIQEADAADLTQDVLHAIARNAEQFRYDTQRGTFRGWLFRITINKMRDFLANRASHAIGTGDTRVQEVLAQEPASEAEETSWNHQHAWRLFLWAAEKARVDFQERTWLAFWRTTVEQQSAPQVGRGLSMSPGAVHVARCRVIARVKELLQDVAPP
jgi:RNA polymerase sigma-70 factor (ECF subfamily)